MYRKKATEYQIKKCTIPYKEESVIICIFLAVFSLVTIAVSIIFMYLPSRLDMLFYGRYIESVVPAVILFGYIGIKEKFEKDEIETVVLYKLGFIFVIMMLVIAVVLNKAIEIKELSVFNPNNSVGMFLFYENGTINFLEAILITVIGLMSIVFAIYLNKRNIKYVYLVLILPCIFSMAMSWKTIFVNTGFQSSYGKSIINAAEYIDEHEDSQIYFIQESGYSNVRNMDRLQFLLYDKKIDVIQLNELENIDDGIIFTDVGTNFETQLYLSEYCELMEEYEKSIALYTIGVRDSGLQIPLNRFASQINIQKDSTDKKISNGNEGFLLYGPYTKLEDGKYRLILEGELNEGILFNNSFFDIVNAGGKDIIKKVTNLQQYCDEDGKFELSVDFTVEEILDNCEFRLYVNSGVELEVKTVTLEKINKNR